MALSIVMYHFVRALEGSVFPVKGRTLDEFDAQLDYIAAKCTVVSAEDVIGALGSGEKLPDNAAWLTFDDGYSDHFTNVFPRLRARGWQGSFFPSVRSVRDGEVLEVNKLHFVFAAQPDPRPLVEVMRRYIAEGRAGARTFDECWAEFAKPSRFNPPDLMFVKNMLRRGLPRDSGAALIDELFARFVTADPAAFATELYASADALREMAEAGMHIGSHGASHVWLDRLGPEQQAEEIDLSLSFLRDLGVKAPRWIMCYPHGAYNDSLLSILRERNCAAGLTTHIRVADLASDAPLTLPRLDTNDLPFTRH